MPNSPLRVLFLGDVVGPPGLDVLRRYAIDWRRELNLDLFIVNGENLDHGSGITIKIAQELLRLGIDVVTSGDHIWKNKDFVKRMEEFPFIIRPANYPPRAPGKGYVIWAGADGTTVGIINLIGRVFMYPMDCPFRKAEEILSEIKDKTHIIIVDFHAEATSEKIVMGYFLDGKVSAVLGTHTHIPTADARILKGGTAYITDVGMVGPMESVIGRKISAVLEKYIVGIPVRFPVAGPPVWVNGVLLEIDKKSGKALSIQRWEQTIHLI